MHLRFNLTSPTNDALVNFCLTKKPNDLKQSWLLANHKCYKFTLIFISGSFIFLAIEGGASQMQQRTLASTNRQLKPTQSPNNNHNLNNPNSQAYNVTLSPAAMLDVVEVRDRCVENIWDVTVSLNVLYRENWTRYVRNCFLSFRFIIHEIFLSFPSIWVRYGKMLRMYEGFYGEKLHLDVKTRKTSWILPQYGILGNMSECNSCGRKISSIFSCIPWRSTHKKKFHLIFCLKTL